MNSLYAESIATTLSPAQALAAMMSLADTNFEEFEAAFRNSRQSHPRETTRACLKYLSAHGVTRAGKQILFWLSLRKDYVSYLLQPDWLTDEEAGRTAALLRSADPKFLSKLVSFVDEASRDGGPLLRRALSIVPYLNDYSALLPWLQGLTRQNDERIRSKVSKLICEIRPKRDVIERQLQAGNARVRANAIEALWDVRTAESAALLRSALSDTNHRVLANALVGLHLQGDASAVEKMIAMAGDSSPLLRAAVAWAIGHVADRRGIPALEALLSDPDLGVRQRAQSSLDVFPKQMESATSALSNEGGVAESTALAEPEAAPVPTLPKEEEIDLGPMYRTPNFYQK